MMYWKRRARRHLSFAVLGGIAASLLYFGLEFTTRLHGFAVKALGPAIDLVWHNLDPKCYSRPYCELEVLAMNVVLYAFWIFLVLMVIDAIGQLKRHRRQ